MQRHSLSLIDVNTFISTFVLDGESSDGLPGQSDVVHLVQAGAIHFTHI